VNILEVPPSYKQEHRMTRRDREELNRKLVQARRLALEPSDPLTRERLAELIEELEFRLQDQLRVA
jgi:hypothetical protein